MEIRTLGEVRVGAAPKEEGSGIYKITSPLGRIYVGKAIDLRKRKRDYKYLKCKTQHFVYNSIMKYGFGNHTFEIIENCSPECLSVREVYYIALLKTNKCRYPNENGMNCTDGGEGSYGYKHSEETRLKMSEKQRQLKRSLESNLKRSASLKGRPVPPNSIKAVLGIKQSDEHKAKRIKNLLRKVIDTKSGYIYSSLREAAEVNNINYGTLKGWLSGRYLNKSNLLLYNE